MKHNDVVTAFIVLTADYLELRHATEVRIAVTVNQYLRQAACEASGIQGYSCCLCCFQTVSSWSIEPYRRARSFLRFFLFN